MLKIRTYGGWLMNKLTGADVFWLIIRRVMLALWLGAGLMPASALSESAVPAAEPQEERFSAVMNSSLFGLCFTDQNNGWLVGKSGTIVRTSDGGATWSLQKNALKLHLYDVSFCDARNGWAVGENGCILHTADGGDTWSQQHSGVSGNLRGVQCLTASTAWAAGHGGTLLKTADGGRTWTSQAQVQAMLKQIDSKFIPSLFSIGFSNARTGYAVGHPGLILCTADGGETWQRQQSGTKAILYKVSARGRDAWISGAEGIILRSGDSGATWVRQKSGVDFNLNSIAFGGGKHGFAVGYKCILHTDNEGATWVRHELDLSRWLCDINFLNARASWAVGDSGTIYHTTDGGNHWKLITARVQ